MKNVSAIRKFWNWFLQILFIFFSKKQQIIGIYRVLDNVSSMGPFLQSLYCSTKLCLLYMKSMRYFTYYRCAIYLTLYSQLFYQIPYSFLIFTWAISVWRRGLGTGVEEHRTLKTNSVRYCLPNNRTPNLGFFRDHRTNEQCSRT